MRMWKTILLLYLTWQFNLSNANFYNQLGQSINDMVQKSLSLGLQFKNMGEEIGRNVQTQLSPLNNLGSQIQQQVDSQLLPVYALEINRKIANGMGGTTTVVYEGNNPRTFVIKNGVRSICNGNLQGPNCIGSLEPFNAPSRQDFCYASSHAAINDQICLSFGGINVRSYNNRMVCTATDMGPILQLSRSEYDELCGTNNQGIGIYYANPNDPYAIQIPNPNPHVTCLNNEPGVCRFVISKTSQSGHSSFGNGYSYSYSYSY